MSSVSMHALLPRTSVLSISDWKQKLLKNGVAIIRFKTKNTEFSISLLRLYFCTKIIDINILRKSIKLVNRLLIILFIINRLK